MFFNTAEANNRGISDGIILDIIMAKGDTRKASGDRALDDKKAFF
jgi:hypothetical protein